MGQREWYEGKFSYLSVKGSPFWGYEISVRMKISGECRFTLIQLITKYRAVMERLPEMRCLLRREPHFQRHRG